MNDKKIRLFLDLAGQSYSDKFDVGDPKKRELGAQLLLSEVLEYVIKGLGVKPSFEGIEIQDPNNLKYEAKSEPNKLEMLDGLADVAYTMYWNSVAFGQPLEEAFDMVCDNNLEKFIKLENWNGETGTQTTENWDLKCKTTWPKEVTDVSVIKIEGEFYGVGTDQTGKVRKPSHYKSVNLQPLVN